jgi:3-deoxy-D-manno-octulosonic-acid transferase
MIAAGYRYFFYPLAFLLLQSLRPFLNDKTKEMIADKNGDFFCVSPGRSRTEIAELRPFWIHAASGEIEYARPVIRELRKQFPRVPVIVTYSSPSAKKILQGLPEIAAWGALPWDQRSRCRAFLQAWRPRCLLIARTDVWPVMAETCRREKIPSLLFSATFAENSSRLDGISGRITTWALNSLREIQCVSQEDLQQLGRLPVRTPVRVCGDTRFEQVFYRLENPKPLKESLRPAATAVLVAGSTWPEDEQVLIPAFRSVKSRCKLVLAPHEIQSAHLEAIEALLCQNGLTFCRYSRASEWKTEDVLIVDEVGILAELYTWGTFSFVGGSFRKQVHSVMEPLAAGLPVLVGPFHANNREALEFKNQRCEDYPIVQEVKTSAELALCLENSIRKIPASFAAALKQTLAENRSSTENVIRWCEQAT